MSGEHYLGRGGLYVIPRTQALAFFSAFHKWREFMHIISAEKPQLTKHGHINLIVTFGTPRPAQPRRKTRQPWPVIFDPMEPVPFTASPDDSEPHGVELYERAMAGEFGPIAPYIAPPITPAQRNAEALAYLASTDWYVVRKAETGAEIPADIAKGRQEAREALG